MLEEEKKQRFTIETSLKRMRYILIDHVEGCVIESVSAHEVEKGKALFEKAIELNRKHDDDGLYLNVIDKL